MSALGDAVTLLGWAFLGYFVLANLGYYLPIHAVGLVELLTSLRNREWNPVYRPEESPFLPGIAIVTPAYNEASMILDTVGSFLNAEYPDKEVVVVNDGSTDDTLAVLHGEFDLRRADETVPEEAPCESVRAVYRAASVPLVVIDKENGGLGDAQNAGIWFTDKPLVCIVDADTMLNRRGLFQLLRPFLDRPAETIAVGGVLHAFDAFEFEGDVPTKKERIPAVIRFQVIEYFRTFYSNRLGMARLGCLHLISGGIGLFRTDLVRAVNGYNRVRSQHAEDLDLVLRLHKHMKRTGQPYRIDFVPDPVAWTDLPDTVRDLGHQRRLWLEGLLQVIAMHRDMFYRPRYGLIGLFVLPGLVLVEGVGRLTEVVGYVVVAVAFLGGLLNVPFLLLFTAISIGFGVLLSWIGILSDVLSFRLYDRPRDVLSLLAFSVLEVIGFRQLWSVLSLPAVLDFLWDDTEWGLLVDDAGVFADLPSSSSTMASGTGVTKTASSGRRRRITAAVLVAAVLVGGIVVVGLGPFVGSPPGSANDAPIATARPVSNPDAVTWDGTNDTALVVAPGTEVTFTVAASDPEGTLGGVEWYVDEFRGERSLSGAEDTGTWTQTFESPGVHYVEAAVFDDRRTYTDSPARWTVTVLDSTATRGTLQTSTIDVPTRAVYVWAGSAERLATDDDAAARFFGRLDEAGINTVYLDAYVIEDAPREEVAAFLRAAHDRGLHVNALVGAIGVEGVDEAERLTTIVVAYNADETTATFDGLRYDVEPGTDDVSKVLVDYVAYLDRIHSVEAAGESVRSQGLPIGIDVGPGWIARAPGISDQLITHPQVDYLVVQAYHEEPARVRSSLSAVVTKTDKPYVLGVETEELPGTAADANITLYEQGPDATTDLIRTVGSDPPSSDYHGIAVHFYGSAVSTWDAIRGGHVDSNVTAPGDTVSVTTRVVYDDYFTQSAHRSQVVVLFRGADATYLTASSIEPAGWSVTNTTVEWTVPDDISTGTYRITVLLLDTTVEDDDRTAVGTRTVPVEADRIDLGTVTVRNGTSTSSRSSDRIPRGVDRAGR